MEKKQKWVEKNDVTIINVRLFTHLNEFLKIVYTHNSLKQYELGQIDLRTRFNNFDIVNIFVLQGTNTSKCQVTECISMKFSCGANCVKSNL